MPWYSSEFDIYDLWEFSVIYENEPWMWITIMVYDNFIHDLLESMLLNKIY